MIAAETEALEAEAIQRMYKLKEEEVNFYKDRFISICTQAAVIGGFLCEKSTHSPQNPNNDMESMYYYVWGAYLLSATLGLGFMMHCLVCGIYCATLGESLSLRGQEGAVLKACALMKSESKHVLRSFVLLLVSFAANIVVSIVYRNINCSIDYEKQKEEDCVYEPFNLDDGTVGYVTLPITFQVAMLAYSLRTVLVMYKRMSHEKFGVMDDTEILLGEPITPDGGGLKRWLNGKKYLAGTDNNMQQPLLSSSE
jgi:hypothetical protein